MREQITKALHETSTPTLRARLKTALQCDVRHHLPLQQPVLYLQAKHDWLVHQHAFRNIRALQSNLTIKTLDAPHLILQFNAAEATAEIDTFIKKHSGKS